MPDDVREFTIHPAADAFPMLGDDELLELAQDIKQKGLLYPIVLDYTGCILVDGRNRFKACALAGVTPRFDRLPEGADLDEYVMSVNIARRHMNAGQRAISVALIWPETRQGKRTDLSKILTSSDLKRQQLSTAREIVRHPDLARMVLSNALKFDAALVQARQRVQIAAATEHYFAILEADALDLADAVREGQLSLYAAWGTYEKRQEDNAEAIAEERGRLLLDAKHLCQAVTFFDDENLARLRRYLRDPAFRQGLDELLQLNGKPPPKTRHGAAAFDKLTDGKFGTRRVAVAFDKIIAEAFA